MPDRSDDRSDDRNDYRGGDLNVAYVRRAAFAVLGAIVLAAAGAGLLLRARGPAANTPPHPFTGAAPLLQSAPQIERSAYFDEKRRQADSAGWVDRRAGIARIPVDDAMRLLAARTKAAPSAREAR